MVGGGVFALTALQGGGGSPEEPVEALFEAIDSEDVIGMLESLTAPERDALLDPTERLAGELRRIGVADESFDLNALEGIDFEVADLELEATELTDDLAEVRIVGGQITVTVSPDQLPISADLRQAIEDAGGDLSETPQPEITDLAGSDDPLLVQRHDGRWGVSLGYTIAESARRDSGAARPNYGSEELAPLGADTPEGAVEGFMAAIDDGDVRAVIGHLDPEEMAALYDYAPLFLPELEQQADLPELARQLTINDLQLNAEGEGDTRRVSITALEAVFEPEGGERIVFRFADGCWEVETTGRRDRRAAPVRGRRVRRHGAVPGGADRSLGPDRDLQRRRGPRGRRGVVHQPHPDDPRWPRRGARRAVRRRHSRPHRAGPGRGAAGRQLSGRASGGPAGVRRTSLGGRYERTRVRAQLVDDDPVLLVAAPPARVVAGPAAGGAGRRGPARG